MRARAARRRYRACRELNGSCLDAGNGNFTSGSRENVPLELSPTDNLRQPQCETGVEIDERNGEHLHRDEGDDSDIHVACRDLWRRNAAQEEQGPAEWRR